MKFKHDNLEAELKNAHPAVQGACLLIEDFSVAERLPEPVVTDVEDHGLRANFSWHKHHCAVDFRITIYNPDQLAALVTWMRSVFRYPMWELITRPHGTGPHIHLARRDSKWKSS